MTGSEKQQFSQLHLVKTINSLWTTGHGWIHVTLLTLTTTGCVANSIFFKKIIIIIKKKHRESVFVGFKFAFVKLRTICKSAPRLSLADAIGQQNGKGTNQGTSKKRTSTDSSLMQGDAGHAQQGCVCVHVDRIHNTFLIINRFGVLAKKSSCILCLRCPIFKSPPRSCCRRRTIAIIYSVTGFSIAHVCK